MLAITATAPEQALQVSMLIRTARQDCRFGACQAL
jgi:hypothetical protein